MKRKSFLFTLLVLSTLGTIFSQSATITEETISIPTYNFGDPDPLPILAENPKIFPYFKFDGYEQESTLKDWKVVKLENDYIQVWVLPEIGGKIWGAVEKASGEEFLYKNDVIKFRNVAMRGPWTSGGIELNFGIIGHSPNTATPVDYKIRNNDDGSVTCVVGTMDLAARTRWWVEITLEPGKAYFETNTSWYNGTALNQSYYNWMTAAAAVSDDLEFIYPGDQELTHGGSVNPWPIDEAGRDLSFYKNNNFGSSKSKHVVGEYNDIFGGYYHEKNFGFGHWGLYEEIPGQKLWLWALSRSGGIWEDLLTDTDGQYMEFQAGRLFNQYSPGQTNPISQANFDPNVMDRWHELWFPFKDIGGMVAASEYGVLNVQHEEDHFNVGLNALQHLDHEISIVINGAEVLSEELNLDPMGVFTKTFPALPSDQIEVIIHETELHYRSKSDSLLIDRPFSADPMPLSQIEELYCDAWEDMKFRLYDAAEAKFSKILEQDPYHRATLVKLAELEYRKTNYPKALDYANTVLKMDTYDSGANYFAGLSYRAMQDPVNALESLGWSARDMKYRSVGFAQMAEIYLSLKNYARAETYAKKSLDYNTYNLNARKVLAVTYRNKSNRELFDQQINQILKFDPLNHFTVAENYFMTNSGNLSDQVTNSIHNEFPAETILELALDYMHLGCTEEAIMVLQVAQSDIKNKLWLSYLLRKTDEAESSQLLKDLLQLSIEFVFPYRIETVPVLEWAAEKEGNWKLKYLLAQNYLAVNQQEKGKKLLKELGETPDMTTFYRFRAQILKDEGYSYQLENYEKALETGREHWRVYEEFIQFYLNNEKYTEALELSSEAYENFPGNYNIGLVHSKALLYNDRFQSVLEVLYNINILPYEHARESRRIYERSHVAVAQQYLGEKRYDEALDVLKKSKEWPENIGVGKPYNPDERAQDYLLALVYDAQDSHSDQREILQEIVNYTKAHINRSSPNHVFGVWALESLGEDEEAQKLLTHIENNSEANNANKISLALYNQDHNKLEDLLDQKVLDKIEWELYRNFLTL